MRSFVNIVVLLSCFSIQGQVLDTIYANDQKNVALFFPSAIRQGITGSSDFVFTYNREKEQYFGLLQATPGVESNLLAITSDGQVFAYILKYAATLPKLNYFIAPSESIGNEKRQPIQVVPKVKKENDPIHRTTYFQKFSVYLLKSKLEKIAAARKKGVKLRLQKMTYNRTEVYLVLELKNDSGIDFEIDYLKVYGVSGNQKRKASYQKLQKDILYAHKMPLNSKHKQSKQFVLVLPKFVLGTGEKLQLELKERNGNRQLSLEYKR